MSPWSQVMPKEIRWWAQVPGFLHGVVGFSSDPGEAQGGASLPLHEITTTNNPDVDDNQHL